MTTERIRFLRMNPSDQQTCWTCTWQKPVCKEDAAFWHPIYGELCPNHALEVVKTGEKVRTMR